jgi:hypothetical protein
MNIKMRVGGSSHCGQRRHLEWLAHLWLVHSFLFFIPPYLHARRRSDTTNTVRLHIQRGRYRFPNFVRCPAQRMNIEMCIPGSSLHLGVSKELADHR